LYLSCDYLKIIVITKERIIFIVNLKFTQVMQSRCISRTIYFNKFKSPWTSLRLFFLLSFFRDRLDWNKSMQIRARITFDLGRIQSHPNSEGRNLYVPSKGTRTIRERFLDDRVEMEQNEEAPVPISRFSPRSDFIIGSQSSLSTGSTVGTPWNDRQRESDFLSCFVRILPINV